MDDSLSSLTENSPILKRPIILGDLTLASPTTQLTIGSGGSGAALVANPSGFLVANIGSTDYLIPYYNSGTSSTANIFLLLSGGTMSGTIAMGSNKITGLAAGTTNGDALRYEQVVGVYLPLAGGTMAGAIAMGTNKITGLAAGTTNGDALRYEQIVGAYLLLTGGQLSGNLSFDNSSTHGVVGTATNDDAATGNIGQWVNSSQGTATNFPTSTQWGDLVNISLTAGDWDVSMVLDGINNGSTQTVFQGGISTTSGNSATGLTFGDNAAGALVPTAVTDSSISISNYRMKLTGTTTVYLKYFATYAVGTPQAKGRISARRVR